MLRDEVLIITKSKSFCKISIEKSEPFVLIPISYDYWYIYLIENNGAYILSTTDERTISSKFVAYLIWK